MATNFVILPLIGAAVLLSAAGASARERSFADRGGCSFCAPHYIAVEPQFDTPATQTRAQYWTASSASPYTRFDIEGIRLMTRMP